MTSDHLNVDEHLTCWEVSKLAFVDGNIWVLLIGKLLQYIDFCAIFLADLRSYGQGRTRKREAPGLSRARPVNSIVIS